MALANYISNFKKSKDYKQKEVADSLSKSEAEISKWLSGVHNLTLQSIFKLEAACSIKLLNPAIFETVKKTVSYSFEQIDIPVVPNQKDFGDLQYLDWYLNKSSGCQATEFTTEETLETKDINTLLSY